MAGESDPDGSDMPVSRSRRLFAMTAIVALIATGGHALSATAEEAVQDGPSNPNQAWGEGIITVEQTNMCMWGSTMTLPCFPNPHEEGDPGWEEAELDIAQRKRESLITQYERHLPDVITVSEGCLSDLEFVADAIGYQLRYQETGGGADDLPRQCTVDRGAGVNAILAAEFTGEGPQGYFEEAGHRSYICAQVSTAEWDSVRVCTSHLSLPSQDDHQEIECEILRDEILDASDGFVIFAGDVNMKGANQNCAPDRFHGLKNTEKNPDQVTPQSGLQHIYYSANGFWRQSCAWSYAVADTDHRGFLLELGVEPPDGLGECWRGITE